MIFRNRPLDVALEVLGLVLITVTLALSARNVSYALSPGEPLAFTGAEALLAASPEDRYVALPAQIEGTRVLPYFRYGVHYYYFPLKGSNGSLYVRSLAAPREGATLKVEGRLQRFDSVAFSTQVREAWLVAYGQPVPRSAWIVLQGESPAEYVMSLVAWLPLGIAWLVLAYLLVRSLQRKPALPWTRLRTTDERG